MSWLCPTELDRRRAVDTSERVAKARTFTAMCVGVAILVVAPILSWWLIPLFALAVVNISTVDRGMRRAERPENVAARGMLGTAVLLAVAAGITGGPESPLLPLLVIPMAMAAARFRAEVVKVGVALTLGLALAVAGSHGWNALIDHPELTIVTAVIALSVAGIVVAIQGAELQHREESVLDPLTGLLNRKSLLPRFKELREQARQQGAPICMIAADLDHFKEVNDTFGHDRGDLVLKEASYEMRKCMRSFELFYRLGGEEFLVVVPGASIADGRELAERMRAAVERARPAGIEMTVSLGVGAAEGDQVDFEHLFNAADQALYEAKHAGRNRIASIEVREDADPEVLERLVGLRA